MYVCVCVCVCVFMWPASVDGLPAAQAGDREDFLLGANLSTTNSCGHFISCAGRPLHASVIGDLAKLTLVIWRLGLCCARLSGFNAREEQYIPRPPGIWRSLSR